jgi:hypothetical protein
MYWYGFADAGVFLYTPSIWYNSASVDLNVRMHARTPASAAWLHHRQATSCVCAGASATTATVPTHA